MNVIEQPTPREIELVAAAMWDSGVSDGRAKWVELHPKMDRELINEFREQASVGLQAFINIRSKQP